MERGEWHLKSDQWSGRGIRTVETLGTLLLLVVLPHRESLESLYAFENGQARLVLSALRSRRNVVGATKRAPLRGVPFSCYCHKAKLLAWVRASGH